MGSFTLNLVEALVAIGIPRERALTLSEMLERSVDERYSVHALVLATKRDLAELELRIVKEIGQSNDRISQSNDRISQTNERISQLDTRIAETKVEIIKWTLGAMVAMSGLLIAVIRMSAR
jgi:septal ring factor EnvC (AmiA/AmiB activator)